jgi:hypothetical protein
MERSLRFRFWLEAACASLGSGLLMLTMYRGSWIETLFGVDPDQGSGAVEGLVVTTVLAVALASAFGARQEWRRSSQG